MRASTHKHTHTRHAHAHGTHDTGNVTAADAVPAARHLVRYEVLLRGSSNMNASFSTANDVAGLHIGSHATDYRFYLNPPLAPEPPLAVPFELQPPARVCVCLFVCVRLLACAWVVCVRSCAVHTLGRCGRRAPPGNHVA